MSACRCDCGALTMLGICDECDTIALSTPEGIDRLQALERVLGKVDARVEGTGGGHEAWTATVSEVYTVPTDAGVVATRGEVYIIVTNDDGFTPGIGDDVVVGICADPEWCEYIEQYIFSWESAAAGLADVLTALRGN